jgi:hypothetical protein
LVIATSVVGTILLALGAFWLSFTALSGLAVIAGIPEPQAWVWPLIVDGVILEATLSVVALRDQAAAARRFAWLLLSTGAAVSVAANITHAVLAVDARVPALIPALAASVPPLVLLAMTHLTVELLRNAEPPPSPDTAPAAPSTSLAVIPASTQRPTPQRTPMEATTRDRALELAGHMSRRQIAAELGVHPTTVGRWLNTPDHPMEEADEGEPR